MYKHGNIRVLLDRFKNSCAFALSNLLLEIVAPSISAAHIFLPALDIALEIGFYGYSYEPPFMALSLGSLEPQRGTRCDNHRQPALVSCRSVRYFGPGLTLFFNALEIDMTVDMFGHKRLRGVNET